MADIFPKEERSRIMSKVSSSNTAIEVLVAKFLFSRGFRYRKNCKRLPGKPDIVLAKYKTALFINGCFWHGHDCKYAILPKTRPLFWLDKITKNKIRDLKNIHSLEERGWNVITIWQCHMRTLEERKNILEELVIRIRAINNRNY